MINVSTLCKNCIHRSHCITDASFIVETCGMYKPQSDFSKFLEIISEKIADKVAEKIKAQEPKEMTTDEWYEWKKNPNRDPVCLLWEHDTTPMWVLNPNDIHEPALLMGKLKLFAGKPTHEQCKAVKWE